MIIEWPIKEVMDICANDRMESLAFLYDEAFKVDFKATFFFKKYGSD